MIRQIKAEFLKLLTVRSTYILVIFAMLLTVLFGYFGTSAPMHYEEVCDQTGEVMYSDSFVNPALETQTIEEVCPGGTTYKTLIDKNLPKEKLLQSLQETIPITVTLITIVAILLMAHEFRHGTISYTLTISNSRSKVLLSKLLVVSIFTVVVTLLALGLSCATVLITANIKNLILPPQDFNWLYVVARHVIYSLGYVLFCLGVTVLVKNLTASIAAAFVLPTLDGIAALLLASRDIEPIRYLPFMALDRFGSVAADIFGGAAHPAGELVSVANKQPPTAWGALGVFGFYLIILWVVAWVLFLRNDAN